MKLDVAGKLQYKTWKATSCLGCVDESELCVFVMNASVGAISSLQVSSERIFSRDTSRKASIALDHPSKKMWRSLADAYG